MINTDPSRYSATDLAYIAGLLEGSATVYLNKHNQAVSAYPDYDLVIEFKHKNNDILYKIYDLFNVGAIKSVLNKNRKIRNWRMIIKESDAYGIFVLTQPYLIARKHLANVVLEYWEWRQTISQRDTYFYFRINEYYRMLIRLLNQFEDKYSTQLYNFIELREKLKLSSNSHLNLSILEFEKLYGENHPKT